MESLEDLAIRVMNGDPEAFEEIYRRKDDGVRSTLFRKVCSDDVEDLSQEIWVRVWDSLTGKGYDPRFRFESYLYGIVRNVICRYYSQAELVSSDTGSSVLEKEHDSDVFLDVFLIDTLWDAWDTAISDDDRIVLNLVFWQDLSEAEAAARLGIARSTLHDRKRAALRKLERALKTKGVWIGDSCVPEPSRVE